MTDFAENLGEPSPTWLTSISTKKSLVKVVQTTFFHGFIAFFHEKWRKFNFRNLHTCATLSAIKNLSFNNNHLCKLISWQVSETGCQPFGPLFAKTYFLGIHHLQKNGFSATVFGEFVRHTKIGIFIQTQSDLQQSRDMRFLYDGITIFFIKTSNKMFFEAQTQSKILQKRQYLCQTSCFFSVTPC